MRSMSSLVRSTRNIELRSRRLNSRIAFNFARANSSATWKPFYDIKHFESNHIPPSVRNKGSPATNQTIRQSPPQSDPYPNPQADDKWALLRRLRGNTPFDPYSGEYDAVWIAMEKKRKLESDRYNDRGRVKQFNGKSKPRNSKILEGSNEEILAFEVAEILSDESQKNRAKLQSEESTNTQIDQDSKTKPSSNDLTTQEVEIIRLSSTGNGLAYSPTSNAVFVVPLTVPGDKVVINVYKAMRTYFHADLVKIVEPSKLREGTTPGCGYFGKCSGCQLQMLPYEEQLKHKQSIVENAFKHFSDLPAEKVPAVLETMGSPLQYGYRTKLTPHFSMPRSVQRTKQPMKETPPIGFNKIGKLEPDEAKVMDIEHCPIGTPILQEGLTRERERVKQTLSTFTNGKTILLRESTQRTPTVGPLSQNGQSSTTLNFDDQPTVQEMIKNQQGEPEYQVSYPTHTDYKSYTTEDMSTSTEYIGPYKFDNKAGSFFQNNNSILRPFTNYVFDNCIPKNDAGPKIKYLLDAYCGSGLFTITLSPLFSSALGIDLDRRGIEAARQNAKANTIPNAGFIEADAKEIFADVPFPPEQSLVVIDPPRKGASVDFLQQLCRFGARRVVYVSCNVHTQARDVGMIVSGKGLDLGDDEQSWRYEIESLKGFDFFPQTGHVEGVCILKRVEKEVKEEEEAKA